MTIETSTSGALAECVRITSGHTSIPRNRSEKLRSFVEDTNWDEGLLKRHPLFDGACLGLLLLALILLAPLFFQIFQG